MPIVSSMPYTKADTTKTGIVCGALCAFGNKLNFELFGQNECLSPWFTIINMGENVEMS